MLFPSMRNVKIRRNQRRGGSPCPPVGGWFTKLFPAVQILQNQNRRNVCPCRTGLRREQAPALPLYGFIYSAAGTCVRVGLCMAGVDACHYARDFYFHHSRDVCPRPTVYGRARSPAPTAADNVFPAQPGPPSSYSPAGSSTMMVVRKFILLSGRCSLSKL